MNIIRIVVLLLTINAYDSHAQNIFRSACQGNVQRLDSMLHDTPIDIQDNRGRTLMHWAVACRQQEVFDYLIDQNIAINSQDHQGKTAMHVAIEYDNEAYFDLVTNSQTKSSWVTPYGASLLELAILKRNNLFIKKLIDQGVDIDAKTDRGRTALEIAHNIGATQIDSLLKSLGADSTLIRTMVAEGTYFGQKKPDMIKKIFAPNFISIEEYEYGSIFNEAGDEFYYGVDINGKAEMRFTQLIDNQWSKPKTILSHERWGYNDPFLSPDEQRLYFISQRPLDGNSEPKQDHDIWYVERSQDGWSEPLNAGPQINTTGNEYYISFTNEGTMYFSSNRDAPDDRSYDQDIYYSESVDGIFQKPVRLGDAINTVDYEADVFIDPQERYMIFCSTRDEGLGRGDLYVSFKTDDGSWSQSVNMGPDINTVNHELCPFVTADGNYLLYTSNEDIYWVSIDVIDRLRTVKN